MRITLPLKRTILWLLAAVLLLPSGCRLGGRRSSDDAQVRLINAAFASDELTVAVDGQRVWKRSPYRNNTGYQGVPEGRYDVRLDSSGRGDLQSVLKPMEFRKGRQYTVLALSVVRGGGPQTAIRVFEDDRSEGLPSGQARVRFINAASGVGRVDVLFNNIVGLARIGLGGRSVPLLLDEGDYDIKVNASGGYVTPLIGPVSLRLDGGHTYTLVAMGGRTASSLSLEVYPDDM